MKILLVQPRTGNGKGLSDVSTVEPFGLELVAGSLKPDHQVKILDFINEEILARVLDDFQPEMCGISCSFTIDVYRTRFVAEKVKEWSDKAVVFVGGHHASLNPGDFYDKNISFVVIGEGEVTTRQVVESISEGREIENIPGLAINREEDQLFTGARKLIGNLDELPRPARELTREYRQHYFLGFRKPLAVLETARGCPYRCNFCSVWKFYRGRCRSMSSDRVVADMADIDEEFVLISDDNFFFKFNRAMEIVEKLIAEGIKKNITIQARSDSIVNSPEILPRLKKAGVTQVFIGFEKIDDSDLDEVNKQNTTENNEKALELLDKHGIGVVASFIVDPQFNRQDFKKMVQYIKKFKIQLPTFSVLTPLPGTELYEKYKEKLITRNWELFDLMHSVIPTKLPQKEFYRELARLYLASYFRYDFIANGVGELGKNLLKGGGDSHNYVAAMLRAAWHFINPRTYTRKLAESSYLE